MKPSPQYSVQDLLALVASNVTAVEPAVASVSADTPLMGQEAVIDSVGFVTLLVGIEQNLGGAVDLAAWFMAQGDRAPAENPFRTAGSLADHLHRLLTTPA
jgi:hypothetical protein